MHTEFERRLHVNVEFMEDGAEKYEGESRRLDISFTGDISPRLLIAVMREVSKLPRPNVTSTPILLKNEKEIEVSETPRGNDPEIPRFRKMEAIARKVKIRPYTVDGTHRHRAQAIIMKNGKARYET